MAYNKKQATGGSCTSSPGDKIKGGKERKPSEIKRLDSLGGSHLRGSGNSRK